MMPPIPLGRYRHYKGNEYSVLGIAKHSETQENLFSINRNTVITVCGYSGNLFEESVMIAGRTIPRFRYLGEE